MEMEEIVKILIFVVVLVIMVAAGIYFFGGEGGDVFGSIKNFMRFGKG